MERAKVLRRAQTDAEAKLWSRLRASQLGVRFRRQHPIDGYVADLVCVEHRLIVELDGSQHLDRHVHDVKRTQALEALGFRVLRFWNNDALERTQDVLESIVRALAETPPPHPSPLPRRRRGRGSKIGGPEFVEVSGSTNPLPPTASPLGGEGRARGRGVTKSSGPEIPKNSSKTVASAFSVLHLRAHLYTRIRAFFADRDVLEVETPILSAAGNTEPNIESFSTTFSGHLDAGARERWMRTSPEHALKRLLAAGVGDCYELGRVFRNAEAGRRHNPEFTMLEWYRVGWDHQHLIDESIELVQAALALLGRHAGVVKRSYRDWFERELGLDPFSATLEELRAPLVDIRLDGANLGRDDWLDLLITHRLQPAFPRDRISVIFDYPATQCALAKIRPGQPSLGERFELYLGPYELANGYHELNDALEQRARFERDNQRRRARGQREMPIDERLLDVLDHMPDCAGVALGIERLLMCMAETDAIGDVLAFAFVDA